MKPGLMVRWVRKKQLKENRAHFAAKNLSYDVDEIRDLNYLDDGNEFHTMDLYGPKGSQETLPAVMLIHGGGYVSCEKFINECQAKFFAQQGFRVANINYTLQPEGDFIEVMRELFAALHWMEENARQYQFDPDGICVSGDSGGGHYALLAAAIQGSTYLQDYFGVRPLKHGICGTAASCPMTDLRPARDGKDMTSRFLRKNTLHSGRLRDDTVLIQPVRSAIFFRMSRSRSRAFFTQRLKSPLSVVMPLASIWRTATPSWMVGSRSSPCRS